MKIVFVLIAVTYCVYVNSYASVWSFSTSIGSRLLTYTNPQQVRYRKMMAVGGYLKGTVDGVLEIIENCTELDGTPVNGFECGKSVFDSAVALAIGVGSYQTVGTWYKRENQDALRAHFERRIPEGLMSDFFHHDDSLIQGFTVDNDNHTAVASFKVRASANHTNDIGVTIHKDNRLELYHIDHRSKRDGFNGYKPAGSGSINVYLNSDAITDWTNALGWMHSDDHQPDPNQTMDVDNYLVEYFVNPNQQYVGMSLEDEKQDGRNGQFIIEGIPVGIKPVWKTGLNWCFGVYPTNCD